MGTLLFIGPGGGSSGAQSLQAAYDGGPTITMADGIPVTITGGEFDPLVIISPGSDPDGGSVVFTAGASVEAPGGAISLTGGVGAPGGAVIVIGGQADSGTGGDVIVIGGHATVGTGGAVHIASGKNSDAGGLVSGQVTVGLGGTAPFESDPFDSDGGFLLSNNGVMYLRKHTVAPPDNTLTGSLRLHVLDSGQEDNLSAALEDGLVHLLTSEGAGTVRERGFRARANGAWGILARGYQETFVGDGTTSEFTFTHSLNTLAPIVQVYEQGESLVQLTTGVTISCTDENTVALDFDAPPGESAALYVTIMGF